MVNPLDLRFHIAGDHGFRYSLTLTLDQLTEIHEGLHEDEGDEDADPAIPGSRVVANLRDCEVIAVPAGWYARCTVRNCTWVSDVVKTRTLARYQVLRHCR